MIALEYLSSIQGDTKIFIEDTSPEKRADLGREIDKLIRQGFEVFLVSENDSLAHRVAGYDPELNEWIVFLSIKNTKPESIAKALEKPKPQSRRSGRGRWSARDTRAVVIARTAGG